MESKGFSAKMLVMVLVVVIVLVAGAGGAAYFAVTRALGQNTNPAAKNPKALKDSLKPFDAGEYITNLSDPSGRRVIRVKIELEMADDKAVEHMTKSVPALRDQILGVLRSKSVSDLAGEEGMGSLSKEIVNRLNVKVANGKVAELYFTEFAIQ